MLSRAGGPSNARGKAKTSREKTFRAPVRGLVLNENLAGAKPQGAIVLENWTPIARGARMRRGSRLHATVGTDPVESMMSYYSGTTKKKFAVSGGDIFDITSVADPLVAPTADVTGLNASYFNYVNFTTSGGGYMPCVNGSDPLLMYNGTYFLPVTGTALYSLAYDGQTVNFAIGEVVTGGTSGAVGTVVKDIDGGATGTLWLNTITGTFQDNENLTGSVAGAAVVNGTASALVGAITGVSTSALSHVWVYRNRLYFVEKNTQRAWYLGVDSITGAASSISLNGIFQKGGYLLFGATWSLDAGDGIDDKSVFVSNLGEIAVFQGSYPGGTDWSLVGRYDGAKPLGPRGTMSAGGDLLIAGKAGLVAVSASITKDPAALALSSVTQTFADMWTDVAVDRNSMPWEIAKWPERQIAIISTPVTSAGQTPQCFILNLETGAPAYYTGWSTRCLVQHEDIVYFGTNDGTIMEAEIGGDDNGSPYYCKFAGSWDHCGSEGVWKEFTSARAVFRATRPFNALISVSTDSEQSFPTAPDAAAGVASSLWDEGLWDVALWDSDTEVYSVTMDWTSLQASGTVVSPQIQITSGSTSSPDCEMVSFHLVYNEGAFLT